MIFSHAKAKSHVVLVAAGSGTRIHAAHTADLFDAFLATMPRVMGIGLRICRSIVECHGSMINALSYGNGAGPIFRSMRSDTAVSWTGAYVSLTDFGARSHLQGDGSLGACIITGCGN